MSAPSFDPFLAAAKVRKDFPFFAGSNHGVAYFDTAASSQKPAFVIDRITDFLKNETANIHRGSYRLSIAATENFELAREAVATFINAQSSEEIVFTKSTTESLNLVAYGLLKKNQRGNRKTILVSMMEHHANFVPWQQLGEQLGYSVKYIPATSDGFITAESVEALISEETLAVCVTHCSNILGTINDIAQISLIARKFGALTVVDGAQSISHKKVDVQSLGADFFAFSSHKMFGPSGVGGLYIRSGAESCLDLFLFGGDMVDEVSIDGTTFLESPGCFEAGTPPLEGVIGFHAAVEYLSKIGMDNLWKIEHAITTEVYKVLEEFPELTLHGPKLNDRKTGIALFHINGLHPHDIAAVLDTKDVCVRSGSMCAHPAMKALGIPQAVRVSVGCYNTLSDVEKLREGLLEVRRVFKKQITK